MHLSIYLTIYLSIYLLTFSSRRPTHLREAEDLHPTPTPALTPTRAIAKPIGSAPGTPQKATFSAWLPGRVNRTPGALREPPKRPKRSQNAAKPTASEAPDASGGAEKNLLPPGWGSLFSCNSRAPAGTSGGAEKPAKGSFTGCRLRRPFSTTARAKWWC